MPPNSFLKQKRVIALNHECFRLERRRHEITIEQVAERSGMAQSHVCDIERGNKPASERAALAMNDALLELIKEAKNK